MAAAALSAAAAAGWSTAAAGWAGKGVTPLASLSPADDDARALAMAGEAGSVRIWGAGSRDAAGAMEEFKEWTV